MKAKRFVFLVAIIFLVPTLLMAFNSQTRVIATENPTNTNEPWVITPDAIPTQTFKGTSTVTCFVGPDSAYDVIMASLDAATTSFFLEVYTLSSEPLVNRLVAAQDRVDRSQETD